MSIEYMRHKVAEAYDGDSWKKRVSRMPDTQVEAIYESLLTRGRISTVYPGKVCCRGSQKVSEGVVATVDETAYGRGENASENRVRTDAIPGQLTFEDL